MYFINKVREYKMKMLAAVSSVSMIFLVIAGFLYAGPKIWFILSDAVAWIWAVVGLIMYYTNLQTQKKVMRGIAYNGRSILYRLLRKAAKELQGKLKIGNPGDDQLRHLAQVIEIALDTGFFQPAEIMQSLADVIEFKIEYDANYTEETGMFCHGGNLIISAGDKVYRLPIWD